MVPEELLLAGGRPPVWSNSIRACRSLELLPTFVGRGNLIPTSKTNKVVSAGVIERQSRSGDKSDRASPRDYRTCHGENAS